MSICEEIDLNPAVTQGVLTPGAVAFAASLERQFRTRRAELLEARRERLAAMANGDTPRFDASTSKIRSTEWQVDARPEASGCLTVDVLSPTDPAIGLSMVSGVRLCVADCDLADDWSDLLAGHAAIQKAKQRQNNHSAHTALTVLRPRTLDVDEPNLAIDGMAMSAGIFDFAVSIYHSAKSPMPDGLRLRFELAGVHNHREARFWADVFSAAQRELGLPADSIGTIVAVDNHSALFELDEILHELRHFGAALRSVGGTTQANLVASTNTRRGAQAIDPVIDLTTCDDPSAYTKLHTAS